MSTETPFLPPTWITQGPWQRWKIVLMPPNPITRAARGARVLSNHLRPSALTARLGRLKALGMIGEVPSYWQVLVAAQHNMLGAAAVETKKFYEAQGIGFREHNWRRFFCDPATMMDATGLFQERDDIVRHVLQTFHRHPLYDFQLLRMFDDGPEELLRQTKALLDGAHPLGHQFENLIEDPSYHARLLKQVEEFVRDPVGTKPLPLEYPYEASPELMMAMDQFTTLTGFLRYAARLPATRNTFFSTLGQNARALVTGGPPTELDPSCCDPDIRTRYISEENGRRGLPPLPLGSKRT